METAVFGVNLVIRPQPTASFGSDALLVSPGIQVRSNEDDINEGNTPSLSLKQEPFWGEALTLQVSSQLGSFQ